MARRFLTPIELSADPVGSTEAARKSYVDAADATKAPTSRLITAGTGLTGGGDLSADRTLAVVYGTSAGQAAVGNDARITGAQQASAKNQPGGYAGLDGSSKVAYTQLPVGTAASTIAAGDDSRLTNSRTPTAHASTHASGGSDPVTPAAIGAQPADSDLSTIAALAPADGVLLQRVAGAWAASTLATVKTGLALAKADVGLGSVDNTADTAKPVSTAQQAALDLKRDRNPTIVNLTTISTGNISLTAGAGTVYRITVTGTAATLIAPSGTPVDGEVINLEIWPSSSAVSLTVTGVLLTGGITSPIAIAANKLWSGALRYRGTTSPTTATAAWRLLASSVDA